jgi:hypothetical protein
VPDVVSPKPRIPDETAEAGEGNAIIRGESGIAGVIDIATLFGQGELKGFIERVVHEHRAPEKK